MVGYCLTSATSAHSLFFLYGTGANGKSFFANVISTILGDYAATASMDTLVKTRGDRHPTDLAGLRGARLVTAIETEQGQRLTETPPRGAGSGSWSWWPINSTDLVPCLDRVGWLQSNNSY